MAFHCARRDLVLLRDILRLGTATSTLLTFPRPGGPGRPCLCHLLQARPPRIDRPVMPMFRARLCEQYPTFGAQSWAVIPA